MSEEKPTGDPEDESPETPEPSKDESVEAVLWPQALEDLSDNSPVRKAFENYCKYMGCTDVSLLTLENATKEVRQTAQACLELLRIAEGGVSTRSENRVQGNGNWMKRPYLNSALDIEKDTFSQPTLRPLDSSEFESMAQKNITFMVGTPPEHPTESEWKSAETNYSNERRGISLKSAGKLGFIFNEEKDARYKRLLPYFPEHICAHMIYKLREQSIEVLTMGVAKDKRGHGHGEALVATLLGKLRPRNRRTISNGVIDTHCYRPNHLGKNLDAVTHMEEYDPEALIEPKHQIALRMTLESFPDTPLKRQLLELCAPLLVEGAKKCAEECGHASTSIRSLISLASDTDDSLYIDNPETRKCAKIEVISREERAVVKRWFKYLTDGETQAHSSIPQDLIAVVDKETNEILGITLSPTKTEEGDRFNVKKFFVSKPERGKGVAVLLAEALIKRMQSSGASCICSLNGDRLK